MRGRPISPPGYPHVGVPYCYNTTIASVYMTGGPANKNTVHSGDSDESCKYNRGYRCRYVPRTEQTQTNEQTGPDSYRVAYPMPHTSRGSVRASTCLRGQHRQRGERRVLVQLPARRGRLGPTHLRMTLFFASNPANPRLREERAMVAAASRCI